MKANKKSIERKYRETQQDLWAYRGRKMTEEELKKYSYEEILEMYCQLAAEMRRRGLYEKYLEEKGAGAIELDKAVKKSFEDLYIPMAEKK